jgi:hypothetical protein
LSTRFQFLWRQHSAFTRPITSTRLNSFLLNPVLPNLGSSSRFLDACPRLLDDVEVIDKALNREPQLDWNVVWRRVQDLLQTLNFSWKTPEVNLFRGVFTQKDPDAQPVAKGERGDNYEPTQICATSKTCRLRRTSAPISSVRYAHTYPMLGWTAARTGSATRSKAAIVSVR